MKPKHPVIIWIFAVLLITPLTVIAQQSCPAIVEQAFSQLGTNCADMSSNSICYGYDQLITEFAADANQQFERPADRAELTDLAMVDATPLNTTDETWGIAVMRVQANLPNMIPGQSAAFIMIGDVSMANMVSPDDAAIMPDEMLDVTLSSASDVLSFPPDFGNRESRVVGSLASGTALKADAITADGDWVRVGAVYEIAPNLTRATAWVSAAALGDFDASALTVLAPDSQTPMQTFILSTGLGAPACAEVPQSQLLVQGPSTYELEFSVNGVTVRTYSTVSFSIVQSGNQFFLRVIPITGEVIIPDPAAPDDLTRAIRVPASQYIDIPIVLVDIVTPFGLEISRRVVDSSFAAGFAGFKSGYDQSVAQGLFLLTQALINAFVNPLGTLPPNIIIYVIRPIVIIIPSGVGNPRPIFVFPPPPQPGNPGFPRL
jgi:hypothetical protein